jgi:FtsZ-binding cell division protein ZapB
VKLPRISLYNPWQRIRALELEVENLKRDRNNWQHQALLIADRYDKIRETAAQLRETLTLYRNL